MFIFVEFFGFVGEQIGFEVLVFSPAGPDIEPGRRTFFSILIILTTSAAIWTTFSSVIGLKSVSLRIQTVRSIHNPGLLLIRRDKEVTLHTLQSYCLKVTEM